MPHIGPYYYKKPGYKQIGEWGFDSIKLNSKIDTNPDLNGCHNWLGSMSPTGALMGAWKNNKQQMTQARRLVQMDITNEDISDYQVKLTCANQKCCNPQHFMLMPTNKPRLEQEPKTTKSKTTKPKTIKPKTTQTSKAWWLV